MKKAAAGTNRDGRILEQDLRMLPKDQLVRKAHPLTHALCPAQEGGRGAP